MKTFDFNQWEELARLNPEAFEAIRSLYINQAINKTSWDNRERIRGLQFRLDMERKKSRPALALCIKFSQMMLDKFHNEFVPSLRNADYALETNSNEHIDQSKAEIIPFPQN